MLNFSSVLQRGKAFLTSSPQHENGFAKASEGALFPKVDPTVDGEDCDQDCGSCGIKYPSKWKVDEDTELYGHVNGWATHILVATGKTDWVRDVADEKGSVMEAVRDCKVEPSNGVHLSNTSLARNKKLTTTPRNSCSPPPTCPSPPPIHPNSTHP